MPIIVQKKFKKKVQIEPFWTFFVPFWIISILLILNNIIYIWIEFEPFYQNLRGGCWPKKYFFNARTRARKSDIIWILYIDFCLKN